MNDAHYHHGEICYRVKSSREPHGRAVKEVCCVTSQARSSRPREVRHHWEAREQRQYRHHWKAGYCCQNPFWLMLCQVQGCGIAGLPCSNGLQCRAKFAGSMTFGRPFRRCCRLGDIGMEQPSVGSGAFLNGAIEGPDPRIGLVPDA